VKHISSLDFFFIPTRRYSFCHRSMTGHPANGLSVKLDGFVRKPFINFGNFNGTRKGDDANVLGLIHPDIFTVQSSSHGLANLARDILAGFDGCFPYGVVVLGFLRNNLSTIEKLTTADAINFIAQTTWSSTPNFSKTFNIVNYKTTQHRQI
jgi:hypothetical protein